MNFICDLIAGADPGDNAFWKIRPPLLAALAAAGLAVFFYYERNQVHSWLFIFNGINLYVHEAGHIVFGLFGRFIMFAGGTILQLLMPLIFYFSAVKTEQPLTADFCLLWFATNFFHIAPYVADAREMILPLVGGGEHDWHYLLGETGLLNYDQQISKGIDMAGCVVLALACLCAYTHFRTRKAKPILAQD